jgi:dTDP-4-dehydrorhamnose reductase
MRILILGGDGMLGHQVLKYLAPRHETRVTLRNPLAAYAAAGRFTPANSYDSIDVRSTERLIEVFADFHPQAVVNCVGIVKQRDTAKEAIPSLEINSLLPHRLAVLCKSAGARLVHMSTDCVFDGKKGNYTESDFCDATDLYGRSKQLGEVGLDPAITLRTSIIGLELSRKSGLVEWFLAQKGQIRGFTKAIFSGFTTIEMARIIEMVLQSPPRFGVYQVSSEPINKYELLKRLAAEAHIDINIVPDESFECDRSLDSSRFQKEFGYKPPDWATMIKELAEQIRGRA